MKSAGWYFKKGAQKVYVATLDVAKRLAQEFADATGKKTAVGYDAPRAPPKASSSNSRKQRRLGPAAAAKPKATRRTVKARRNPVMRGVDYTGESWRIRALSPSGATLTAYEDTTARAEALARLLRRQKYAAVTIAQVRKANAKRDNLVKLPKVIR